jgi:hypothetical protein
VPTVQEVTAAVRRSNLPAPARHILLTLASLADPETAEIPEQETPSLSGIAEQTGLGRSTIARFLNLVTEEKWLERVSPSQIDAYKNKVRNRYFLAIPSSPTVGLVPEGDQSHSGTSPGAGLANSVELDISASPTAGLVPERDTLLSTYSYLSLEPSPSEVDDETDATPPSEPVPVREDVERVCQHLAKWIVENGSKPPTITQKWRDAARLMIDRDGRTEEQIIRCIDWCQQDDFWKANIKSFPKLRDQYDTLRLRAVAEKKAAARAAERQGGYVTPASTAPRTLRRDEKCARHPYESADSCGACASERLAAQKGA